MPASSMPPPVEPPADSTRRSSQRQFAARPHRMCLSTRTIGGRHHGVSSAVFAGVIFTKALITNAMDKPARADQKTGQAAAVCIVHFRAPFDRR